MCIADYAATETKPTIVIVVPTIALLDQWYVSLREDLGVDPSEIATFSGESHPPEKKTINLMTVNSARELAPSISASARTFLIVDECHRAGSPENARALAGRHAATLGLSATPERPYDEALDDVIVPALGPVLFVYDYNAARRDGIVVPFDLTNVSVPLMGPEQKRYDEMSRRIARLMARARREAAAAEALERLLQRRAALSAAATLRIPAAVRLVERHTNERIIVFHELIASADSIASSLHKRGRSVAVYHTRIGPELRRENLRLYRQGVFEVLVTCRALDEGVNLPETRVAVIASATASPRQRIQRLGRVLRPAPGKQRAVIYTVYATLVEEERLRQEASRLTGADSINWMRGGLGRLG